MNKDVQVTIKGLQSLDGESDLIERTIPGDYYRKNEKHYIIYDELIEGYADTVHNIIKVRKEIVVLKRSGMMNAEMVFEKNHKHLTCYSTPMGDLLIGVTTDDILIEEAAERLRIQINYNLDINNQVVSDCRIIVDINARETFI